MGPRGDNPYVCWTHPDSPRPSQLGGAPAIVVGGVVLPALWFVGGPFAHVVQ